MSIPKESFFEKIEPHSREFHEIWMGDDRFGLVARRFKGRS